MVQNGEGIDAYFMTTLTRGSLANIILPPIARHEYFYAACLKLPMTLGVTFGSEVVALIHANMLTHSLATTCSGPRLWTWRMEYGCPTQTIPAS
jgi:hypothetical protein